MQRILFSEQVHLAQSNDSFKQSARNLVFKFRQCVKDIIEEGVKSGQYKADLDIEISVMSFLGLFFLLMHSWALNDFAGQIIDKKTQIISHFSQTWGNQTTSKKRRSE